VSWAASADPMSKLKGTKADVANTTAKTNALLLAKACITLDLVILYSPFIFVLV
jgi:hypothetical protein